MPWLETALNLEAYHIADGYSSCRDASWGRAGLVRWSPYERRPCCDDGSVTSLREDACHGITCRAVFHATSRTVEVDKSPRRRVAESEPAERRDPIIGKRSWLPAQQLSRLTRCHHGGYGGRSWPDEHVDSSVQDQRRRCGGRVRWAASCAEDWQKASVKQC